MYFVIYLALIGVGLWAVQRSIIERSEDAYAPAIAFATLGVAGLVPEITTGHSAVYDSSLDSIETVTHTVALGSEQYIWIGMSLLSMVWLIGLVLGIFPERGQAEEVNS